MTREEYQETLIRMYDSKRVAHKGEKICSGINCEDCYIRDVCTPIMSLNPYNNINAYDIVQAVEKWGEEHPIITNKDKFKEIFGSSIFEGNEDGNFAIYELDRRKYKSWLYEEYQEPQESGETECTKVQ